MVTAGSRAGFGSLEGGAGWWEEVVKVWVAVARE